MAASDRFYVHSSIAIILMGKRELIALLNLSSWCLVMVERLFLAVPRGCLQFVIVVFPDHTHYFLLYFESSNTQPDRVNSQKKLVTIVTTLTSLCQCLHPSQQFFSQVETISCLPRLNQC